MESSKRSLELNDEIQKQDTDKKRIKKELAEFREQIPKEQQLITETEQQLRMEMDQQRIEMEKHLRIELEKQRIEMEKQRIEMEKQRIEMEGKITHYEEVIEELKSKVVVASIFDISPLPFSVSPSNTSAKDVAQHSCPDRYYFSSHALFVEVFLCYYHRELCRNISEDTKEFFNSFMACARAGPSAGDNQNSEYKGYLSQKDLDEPGKSAILSVKVPSVQKYLSYNFVYLHQAFLQVNENKKQTGKVDISLYTYKDGSNELFPLVLWETSLANDFDKKRYQLFNTANSTILYQMEQVKMPQLGVIFNFEKMEIHIYFASNGKLVDIILFESELVNDVLNWQCLFDSIEMWSQLIVKMMTEKIDFRPRVEARVCPSLAFDYVYKVYDYRKDDVNNGRTKRSPKMYEKFIDTCEYLIKKDDLQIIRYRLIPGDHIALCSKEFIRILEQLKMLHDDGIVHGDIRLRNIVFNHNDISNSSLIDFDYCGVAGIDMYPSNLCEVDDGFRTDDMMKGMLMSIESDCICMSTCMRFFQMNEEANREIWEACVDYVKSSKLNLAITSLNESSNFSLTCTYKSESKEQNQMQIIPGKTV